MALRSLSLLAGLLLALASPLSEAQQEHAYEHEAVYLQVDAAAEAQSLGEQLLSVPPLSVSLDSRPLLRLGSRSEDVLALRQALEERGFPVYVPVPQHVDVDPWVAPDQASWDGGVDPYAHDSHQATDLMLFDEHVLQAVRSAQLHYGLVEDGIAGPRLYQNLAGSDRSLGEDLIEWGKQIQAFAEEARAQGHSRIIIVNIPSYTLKAIDLETGQTLVESRVVVGKPSSRTPIFTTNIINLKYNPDWTPPPSLAAKGRRYVRPGPNNPMGRVRFSADNNMHIYLHHTNEPDLFNRESRALSAGCVRVEAWDDLAAFVANESKDHVYSQVERGSTHFEKVDKVPVVMAYSLVDVVAGRAARHPDVYGRGR